MGQPERANSIAVIIAGASVGALFEWYDFFLYGSLASDIGRHFFAVANEQTSFLLALIAFSAGFIARPFGGLVFGRIGDLFGRKNTFLATMVIMGGSTFLVGLLPGAETIGVTAPVILVGLRVVQGLAIGGEYGGSAIYIAEHAPRDRRGLYTSAITVMTALGLIASLLVIIACRLAITRDDFQAWGWRIPFLLSFILLVVSLSIRVRLNESPVFQRMKAEFAVSKAPLSETFAQWTNVRQMFLALGGGVMGSTTLWYTAHLYALLFLQRTLKVNDLEAYGLVAAALAIAAPFYLVVGWLSDRLGRRPFMIAGCVLAAVSMVPVFHALTWAANPVLASAQSGAPVTVRADPPTCSIQFDPLGRNRFDATGCDMAKSLLAREGVSYRAEPLATGASAEVDVGRRIILTPEPSRVAAKDRAKRIVNFEADVKAALATVGYPSKASPAGVNRPLVVGLVAFLGVLAAMTFAPQGAFLVELFPARLRYTALSTPYNVGTGWIGGLMPASAFAIVATSGDSYAGLLYPVAFCALSAIIAVLFLPETRGRDIG